MSPRVVVVGTGSVARLHAEALATCPVSVELVAAVDTSAEALAFFAERHQVPRRYGSLEDALAAERPDIVHLCTPPVGHAQQAISCMEAGASVICEKPPVLSLAEYDLVEAAEARTGRFFVPVYQQRSGSSTEHVRRLLADGALGRPLVAVCHTLWYRDRAYYQVPWRRSWAAGGPTATLGIHQIDQLAYLLGDWAQVWALAARLDRDVETEDVSLAHIAFQDGTLASAVNTVLSPRQESSLRLDCGRATVELSHLYGYSAGDWRITPAPDVPAEEAQTWQFPEPDVSSSHSAYIHDIYAAVANGERPSATGRSGRVAFEIVTAIYASALSGRPVSRDDLRPGHPSYEGLPGDLSSGGQPRWAAVTEPAVP